MLGTLSFGVSVVVVVEETDTVEVEFVEVVDDGAVTVIASAGSSIVAALALDSPMAVDVAFVRVGAVDVSADALVCFGASGGSEDGGAELLVACSMIAWRC